MYSDVIRSELTTRQNFRIPVMGKILSYDMREGNFTVQLENRTTNEILIAKLPFEEFSCQNIQLVDSIGNLTLNAIKAKNLTIKAYILQVHGDNIIISRRKNQEEALKKLKIGQVMDSKIISISPFAIFCDIGDGIIAMNHISELSKVFYTDIGRWLKIGDIIQTKIVSINEKESKVNISRKKFWEGISFYSQYSVNQIVKCRVGKSIKNAFGKGYFLEITPAVNGIMDSDRNLEEGEIIIAMIRQIDLSNRKARLICLNE